MVMQKPTAHRAVGFWRTYVSWSMCITSFIVIFLFGFVFFVAAFHKLLKSHPVNQKILLFTVTFALFPYCHFHRSFSLFIIDPRAPRGARRDRTMRRSQIFLISIHMPRDEAAETHSLSHIKYLKLPSVPGCSILSLNVVLVDSAREPIRVTPRFGPCTAFFFC